MLSDLKTLLDIIRAALGGLSGVRRKKARSDAIVELLCVYFLLSDVVEDGRRLLDAVGEDPRKTKGQIPKAHVAEQLKEWDRLIRRQASRLYKLSGRLLGQDALSIIDPTLKTKLQELTGSKFERARSLESVGAALVVYSMLNGGQEEQWQRNIVLSMYPTRTRVTIDLVAADKELNQLQEALGEFRAVCLEWASRDEVLLLSKRARKRTLLP